MSETSKRGRDFEMKVAKLIRLKIDKSAKRNAGSHANWHRRSDIFTDLPIHVEAKDHENIRIKEWMSQAQDAAFGKTPVVAWNLEGEVMATLSFDDLLNLFVEIADQKAEIEDLRRPQDPMEGTNQLKEELDHQSRMKEMAKDSLKDITVGSIHPTPPNPPAVMHGTEEFETHPVKPIIHKPMFTDGNLQREVKLCKNGHICSPGRDTCMTKGCPYSSTYIKPKAKDGGKNAK